jgi:hypothetical protein
MFYKSFWGLIRKNKQISLNQLMSQCYKLIRVSMKFKMRLLRVKK